MVRFGSTTAWAPDVAVVTDGDGPEQPCAGSEGHEVADAAVMVYGGARR